MNVSRILLHEFYPLYFCQQFIWKKIWHLLKKIKILNQDWREVCQPHGFVSLKNLPEKTACCAKTKKPLVLVFFGKNTPFNLLWPKFFLSSAAKICSIYRRLSARMFKCNILVYEFMNTVIFLIFFADLGTFNREHYKFISKTSSVYSCRQTIIAVFSARIACIYGYQTWK